LFCSFKDYENVDDVNRQLEKMGWNIGVRLVEDFLARTNSGKCHDFRETAEKIQLAFKVFENIFQSKLFSERKM
jgi:hypothetical protein